MPKYCLVCRARTEFPNQVPLNSHPTVDTFYHLLLPSSMNERHIMSFAAAVEHVCAPWTYAHTQFQRSTPTAGLPSNTQILTGNQQPAHCTTAFICSNMARLVHFHQASCISRLAQQGRATTSFTPSTHTAIRREPSATALAQQQPSCSTQQPWLPTIRIPSSRSHLKTLPNDPLGSYLHPPLTKESLLLPRLAHQPPLHRPPTAQSNAR
jgi:hypothetical protein